MSAPQRILVVDDDEAIRAVLKDFLQDEGYTLEEAADGATALTKAIGRPPNLVLLDVRLPDMDGLEILRELKDARPDVPVIVITGHGTSSVGIRAMQDGAYDYITKPFDLDEVALTLKRLFEHQALAGKVRELEDKLATSISTRDRLIGRSKVMQTVYKTIGLVAGSDATVLITGETGTGKEVVAKTLHENSPRSRGPSIEVNCAALTETLLESELFGHEKGAYTGADKQRLGRFELANNGTILLDEVGEMSLNTQKKLLRVLQEREIERVGGNHTIKVNVRVIAATNKNLAQEVEVGRFREDLFYRLSVITIHLPPLRSRRDINRQSGIEEVNDIELLTEYFLDLYRLPGMPPARISQDAMEKLKGYSWPGNVRQLQNVIQRAVVLSQGRTVTSQEIDLGTASSRIDTVNLAEKVSQRVPLSTVLAEVERELIIEALRQHPHDRIETARALDISLQDLAIKIQEYGLQDVTNEN